MAMEPIILILTQVRYYVDINSNICRGKVLSIVDTVSTQKIVDTDVNTCLFDFGYLRTIIKKK